MCTQGGSAGTVFPDFDPKGANECLDVVYPEAQHGQRFRYSYDYFCSSHALPSDRRHVKLICLDGAWYFESPCLVRSCQNPLAAYHEVWSLLYPTNGLYDY